MFVQKVAASQAKQTVAGTSGAIRGHAVGPQKSMVREAPRGPAWDFSTIPVLPPERTDRPPSSSPLDQVLRLPGEPLAPGVRRDAERRFGRDFGHVRLHHGPKAAEAAARVDAPAFTLGRHIVAQGSAADPHAPVSPAILSHELTHVVQQAAFHDRDLAGAPVLDAAHGSEREARAGVAAPSPLAAPAIQRAPLDLAKSGQHLEVDLTNSAWRQTLEFEGGQTQIVYVLRDTTTGEYLKVGKTTVDKIANRFGEYVTAGQKWSRKLVADVWTIRARSTKNVEAFEAQIRAGLEKAGARLPWDNTRVPEKGPRLGRPGQGIPDTKPLTETEFIDEVEQLRVRHAPPNIPKRRGMSSKQKAKLKAAEEKAATDASAQAAAQEAQPVVSEVKGVSEGGTAVQPKVEMPPVGEAGAAATAGRVAVQASRLRLAGRFLAREAPGLLLQAILMALFPPEVHIHDDNYAELSSKKIDPALQHALTQQAATLDKLAADDSTQSIWATVTVESDFLVDATSNGDLEIYLQDLRFMGMKITREYLLVEGKKFDVGTGRQVSKTVTYSIPIFGRATNGSQEAIRNFRKVRENLTHDAYKVRLSAMIAMYRIADANPFLMHQLTRDLQGMSSDDDSTVRDVAAHLLSHLKPEH